MNITNTNHNCGGEIYAQIKNQVSLKATLENYGITLRGTYPQFKGLCPFHTDTNESLSVNDEIGKWNCFGCGKFGDVFDFIQRCENCSLASAVLIANNNTAINKRFRNQSLPSRTQEKAITKEHINKPINYSGSKKVKAILEKCWEYFQSQLTPEITCKYLTNKTPFDVTELKNGNHLTKLHIPYGFNQKAIKEFRIGYAPSSIKELVEILIIQGYTKDEIALTGLFIQDKKGNLRAYYKNRIVFPYINENNEILYSIGRRTEFTPLNKYESKYKKQLTYKSKQYVSGLIDNNHLFMEHIAKTSDWIVVTEGITDCIATNMHGIPSISPVTVRFRHSDLSKLHKLCEGKTVYICNDNEINKSGEKGAIQTVEYLIGKGIKASLVTIPRPINKEKIDLCEWFLNHDRQDFLNLLI